MLTSAERVCLLENRLFRGFLPAELDGLLESLSARTVSLPGNCVLWSMGDRVELHRGWLRLLVQDAPENE